ncbi:hypothetical protein GCM10011571_13690 [Marinithermofilum abyssi]|uniref:DUF1292 domain-containing protein n=1 Tax=Marinithermofilum abyssi TaxID=1571185 RepID=A0A8J2VH35_9BACL|nr:DUF1292 domain-containing protein [Marinithermofilum abyssi]GGE13501.1 hypothetical protein GCM10011571_13690 [Marinithermofilum abyssi]
MKERNPRRTKAQKMDMLEQARGVDITLPSGKSEQDTRYRLLKELDLNGKHYAVMCPWDDSGHDAYLFRVTDQAGEYSLEHVEDDYEWEQVADAIDEMLYFDEW